MDKITIYTPIKEDFDSLDLLFDSLKQQTNKEFVWYIVNYGDQDCFYQKIIKYRDSGLFTVEYAYIPSKGKYLATDYIFNHAKTKYILGSPTSYLLKANTIEIFLKHWHDIETKNLNIAEIRALSEDENHSLMGKTEYEFSGEFVDITWHEMILKYRTTFEALSSWDKYKFRECVQMSKYELLAHKITELPTHLFWSSIGRKYQTRYINVVLKSKVSTNDPEIIVNYYNNFVGLYYFLKENYKYIHYNPKYFLKSFLRMMICIIRLI